MRIIRAILTDGDIPIGFGWQMDAWLFVAAILLFVALVLLFAFPGGRK